MRTQTMCMIAETHQVDTSTVIGRSQRVNDNIERDNTLDDLGIAFVRFEIGVGLRSFVSPDLQRSESDRPAAARAYRAWH